MRKKDLVRFIQVISLWFCFTVFPAFGISDSSEIWLELSRKALYHNPGQSLIFGGKALRASSGKPNSEMAVLSHEILAEASIRLFHPDNAFSHLFQAIEIASRNEKNPSRIRCLIQMGRLNWILEDPSKAIYYCSEASRFAKIAGEFKLQLQAEATAAYIRISMNPPGEKADFKKVQELLDYVSAPPVDPESYARAVNLMGSAVYLHLSDFNLASKYYQQAILSCEQMGDEYQAASYSQNLAEIYISNGSIPAAEDLLNETIKAARKMNASMLVYSSLKYLSACAAYRMDYKKAFELQTAFEELKSRHLTESQQLRTNDILQSYTQNKKEIQRKDLENARLASRIESEKKLRQYQVYLLAFVFTLVVLSGLIISNRIRIKKIRKQRMFVEEQNARLETLNDKLRIQTMASEKSRETAENALKSRADFLSVMTHEIRTPIHAIIAASHLIEDSRNSIQTRNNLDILRISAENLHSLINNVLDFNKIESGKVDIVSKPFSLQDLLAGIQLSFLPQAEEKGIDLNFRIDKNLPAAFLGDRFRLGQIFTNLISNALKFTHSGSIEVEVQYSLEKSPEGLTAVFIRDSGIGISKVESERIFDFFSQANEGISSRYGGTGLGLTITSKLLHLMGSQLSLKSEPGKGSTFSFNLQLPETDALFLRSAFQAPSEIDLSFFRILFVEDVEFNRILAQRFFDKWQISCDFAKTGKEAIELAAAHQYDIILLDIRLPDVNGFEVACNIRKMDANNNVPILAMTASDPNEISLQISESGMQGFLGKPFGPDDLRQALEKWLFKTA